MFQIICVHWDYSRDVLADTERVQGKDRTGK
jgi:hypothetical protein